jgi:hypothetical protein
MDGEAGLDLLASMLHELIEHHLDVEFHGASASVVEYSSRAPPGWSQNHFL